MRTIALLLAMLLRISCWGQDNWRGEKMWGLSDEQEVYAFTRIIERYPNLDSAYVFRGIVKVRLEDFRGALSDYNKAIQLNPNFDVAFVNRSIAKMKMKDYQGAIDDCDKVIALKRDHDFPGAYYVRGISKILMFEDMNWLSQKVSDLKTSGCQDLSRAGEFDFTKAYAAIKKYCN